MQKEISIRHQEERRMFRTIEKIVAILSGYGSGKLFECKRGKCRRKSGVMDLVSISDEARERNLSDGDETTFEPTLPGDK